MSLSELERVWAQRLPNTCLPGTLEEQIRQNLQRHKLKIAQFREEIRKEEVYVEYLERLLQDVSKQRSSFEELEKSENGEKGEDCDNDIEVAGADDVIADKNTPPTNVDDVKGEEEESENFAANMCVTEISKELEKIPNEEKQETSQADPSAFVTVIEVNGLKPAPKRPPKLPVKPDFIRNSKLESQTSVESSTERISTSEEHYYDTVASEEFNFLESDSSNENTLSSNASQRQEKGSQSPGASNYVNIEYFIKSCNNNEERNSSSDEEEAEVVKRERNGSYASCSSLESSTPSTRRKFLPEPEPEVQETSENSMYKCILLNIVASESNYVDWLNVLLNYMKAFHGSLNTSQPLVTEQQLQTIFYYIPELQKLHANFLTDLKVQIEKHPIKVGDCFKTLASNLELYGQFLNNYSMAVDTVKKRCEQEPKFAELVRNITQKQLSQQPVNLEDILHKPVARVQKNALVLYDLIKNIPRNHVDYGALNEALQMTQTFLDQFNMIRTKQMFPTADRAQRRLVKNSFIVEWADGHRKLRHLFLFNDVIACAKYKQTLGKIEKYTFELKWYIPIDEIVQVTEKLDQFQTPNIVALKSQASNVRDQLLHDERKKPGGRATDKYMKRLIELESQLVLASPNLPFVIRGAPPKHYVFYLSSEFERHQWTEAVCTLKRGTRPAGAPAHAHSMLELQTWITACRTYLKTNMGSYLLRSGRDERLLVGDLHLHAFDLIGVECKSEIYLAFEVDSYGHFFQKAKTKAVAASTNVCFQWNERFIVDLEGCENLRVLVYSSDGSLLGKCVQKLSRKWLRQDPIERKLVVANDATLRMNLTFIPSEVSLRRIPSGKNGSLFGEKMQSVCKRQKREVPFIITACIREVERRGMAEVGIYRVSGSSLELSKLKKSFETNSYEAEQLLKEVDIHSVTGILRAYLRELPEALFTDKLYPELLKAFNDSNGNVTRRYELLKSCYEALPIENRATFDYILEHLMRVHKHEKENKMSMHNLATVFGPTLLRPAKNDKNKDSLMAGTVDVMAQAGILLCFFQNKRIVC